MWKHMQRLLLFLIVTDWMDEFMFKFIMKRIFEAIPTLLVLITVSFFLMRFAPGNPFSSERPLPPEVMAKAMAATSDEEREALYIEAEKLLARDMPIAPIYQYVTSRLVSPKVGGYAVNNAEDKLFSKDMYIVE
jgi:ABC-type dipeptide/oligopeptide/nickel transport system permease component